MLRRLLGTVLVSVGEAGAAAAGRSARFAVLNGRTVVRHGECPLAELARLRGWDLRASFFSRGGYFDRTAARTANQRLAGIVARRFIDGEMLFDEPYRLRLETRRSGEQEVEIAFAAASAIDCERIEDALPLADRPVSTAALEESAIAALVGRATAEPVLVLFARGERFMSFIAAAGEVRQRRLEVIATGDAEAAAAAAQRAEASLVGWSAASGSEGAAVALRLYLGELRPLAKRDSAVLDSASRALEVRIGSLIEGADALAEPELYGLRFVARRWSFLEAAQGRRALAWRVALPAAAAMLAGGLTLGLLAAAAVVSGAGRAGQAEQHRARLLEQRDALAGRVPNSAELEHFKELALLMKSRSEQVRVDRLLSWLSRELPDGIAIRSLRIQAPDTQASGPAVRPNSETVPAEKQSLPAQPGLYTVHLELTLPGGYDAVEAEAAEVIRRLSARLAFVRSNLDYDATKNRAHLFSELHARAEAFQ